MFTTATGTVIDPLTLTKAWRKAADLCGVAARLHDVRHFHIASLLRNGVPLNVVQARAGHSSPMVPLSIYGHVTGGEDEAAAPVFSRGMAGPVAANSNGLCAPVRWGEFDARFRGDGGWPAGSALVASLPPVELLKVGHHGSAGSTSGLLLDAIRPQAAVISVGPNRFGHPTRSVLRRLRERGIAVYRTDLDGTVKIRNDGRYFEIEHGISVHVLERIRCRCLLGLS